MEKAPESCILCGETRRNLLFEKDGYRVHRCASCGLGFLDPRPTREEIFELYSREYCEKYFVEGGEPGSAAFRKRLSLETHRVRFFRGIKRKGRVLDVGCGYGYFLAACREYGYDVEGLDLPGWASEHAMKSVGLRVTLGEMNEVDIPAERFDVITMWHFLEHSPDPRAALMNAKRWLKQDGVLVVDVPNHEGTEARKNWDDWIGWSLPYHFYHFTPGTLAGLLGVCGFRVIKQKNYHSDTVKLALKRIPVVSVFARTIARFYSGHSVAVVAARSD